MASDWTPTTIGAFCPFAYGKGLRETHRNANGNIKVYGSNGPVGSHDQPLVNEPGIVIGRKGTVGAVHFSSEPFWPIDTTFFVVSEAGRDLKYTYYLLKSIGLEHMNADSAVPGLNRDAAHARQVLVPEYDEQRAIAHILGSLDDKIGLNRRMNRTLEAMARAIFKSWFIDFLPVRAKQRARTQTGDPVRARRGEPCVRPDSGLPDDIAALFPDSFEDSGLGEIPKGWETGKVSDLANVTSGKRPQKRSKEKTAEFNVPLYGGGGIMAYVTEAMIKEPFILTGRVGTLGKIFRITEACWPSDNTLLLFPKDKIYLQFLFFMLQRIGFDSLNRGSTQPLVTQTDLKNQSLIIPSESIMNFFWDKVCFLFEKIDKNILEANTLISLRDTLLPKLISGEVRIPDAERIIDGANL
jgi:type I restriction enzyme, S subunit